MKMTSVNLEGEDLGGRENVSGGGGGGRILGKEE